MNIKFPLAVIEKRNIDCTMFLTIDKQATRFIQNHIYNSLYDYYFGFIEVDMDRLSMDTLFTMIGLVINQTYADDRKLSYNKLIVVSTFGNNNQYVNQLTNFVHKYWSNMTNKLTINEIILSPIIAIYELEYNKLSFVDPSCFVEWQKTNIGKNIYYYDNVAKLKELDKAYFEYILDKMA